MVIKGMLWLLHYSKLKPTKINKRKKAASKCDVMILIEHLSISNNKKIEKSFFLSRKKLLRLNHFIMNNKVNKIFIKVTKFTQVTKVEHLQWKINIKRRRKNGKNLNLK